MDDRSPTGAPPQLAQLAQGYCVLWRRDGLPIESAGGRGFRKLSSYFATDGVQVLACTFRSIWFDALPADAASFRLLNAWYAVDAASVYFQNRVLRNVSPDRFRVIDSAWACDDRHVFHYGKRVRDADAATFRPVGGAGYFTDGHGVWYEGRPVEGADPASFVCADESVYQGAATDRARPYRYGHATEPDTRGEQHWARFFEARPELRDYWWHRLQAHEAAAPAPVELGDGYRRSGGQLYMKDVPLLEPAAASATLLGDSFIADGRRLYSYASYHTGFLDGGPLPGDATRWARLAHGWYQAGDYCYRRSWRGHAEAAKVDGASFEVLNEDYARDRRGVLYGLVRKRGIDPQGAECLGGAYLRVGTQLFHRGNPVAARFDAGSAEYLGHDFIRDGEGRLLSGRSPYRRGVDGATLSFLSPHFAQDRRQVYVYCNGTELVALPGVKPADFRLEQADIGCDGERRYSALELTEAWRQERARSFRD